MTAQIPLIPKLALIGAGLIGGSIARAARASGAAKTIVATARSPETRRRVMELGFADQVTDTNAEAVKDADLVIVSIPVGASGAVAKEIGPHLKQGAILVPQRAVSELQGIYNVAVVGGDDAVEIRMVTPGQRIGSLWVVDTGLKAGERIVVKGLQKVRPGVKVKPEAVQIEEGGAASSGAVPPAAAEASGAKG